MKRYTVYADFNKYKQTKDDRDMDSICKLADGFHLQVQQKFLKEYIQKNPDWKNLLLYHQIGSGKTCTAITLAEQYMQMYPDKRVTVILPARLRTNFFDELISPCGMEKYISNKDFSKYMNKTTSSVAKGRIKKSFMTAIEKSYDIMSYEKFKASAVKTKDLSKWVINFTKDRLIIIDEVHNLISSTYDEKTFQTINETGMMKRVKGTNIILLKYMTMHAHPSCKLIYLTATPIFDNMVQFKELVHIMNPSVDKIKRNAKISDVIDYLRGKVSFFPGTSANAYPKVRYEMHDVPLTRTQDIVTNKIIEEKNDDDNEDKEAFMVKQRQASIVSLPQNKKVTKSTHALIMNNIKEFAPKVLELVNQINTCKGKHVIYSGFVEGGLNVVEAALRVKGWISMKEAKAMAVEGSPQHAHKVYAIWDGSVQDADKQLIKAVMNSATDNMDGKQLRVILGSPSIKEGVSFKHVQHLHLLDPVWNSSAKLQVEGRAIRFCSHMDISIDHPYLKREVLVHIYKSTKRPNGYVQETCDEVIYDKIIPRKQKLIQAAENALKKVAIDYYLFRNMYQTKKLPFPKPTLQRSNSIISLNENDIYLNKARQREAKNATTCPKKRRPDEQGNCQPGFYSKANPQGFPCCYKERKTKQAKTCARGKTPIDGECPEGYVIKPNKHNVLCCYKKRTSSRKA